MTRSEFSRSTPRTVGEARKRVENLDHMRRSMLEDPLTSAMGAPVDEFFADYDKRERMLLAYVLNHSPVDSKRWKWAWNRMEAFLP